MQRVLLFATFITVLLLVLIGGHLYLAARLVIAPALPAPWHGLALAAIALGAALLVLQPIAERRLPLRPRVGSHGRRPSGWVHHAHLVSRSQREDLPGALAGRDPQRPVVLLAHDPLSFHAAAALGVDLQLSGHTHGGQIWPFRYFVRLSTPFVVGHHRRAASQLYVSRGTGFWGPAMRLFDPGEITELTIRAADAASES